MKQLEASVLALAWGLDWKMLPARTLSCWAAKQAGHQGTCQLQKILLCFERGRVAATLGLPVRCQRCAQPQPIPKAQQPQLQSLACFAQRAQHAQQMPTLAQQAQRGRHLPQRHWTQASRHGWKGRSQAGRLQSGAE